jgi:hypothetical protein
MTILGSLPRGFCRKHRLECMAESTVDPEEFPFELPFYRVTFRRSERVHTLLTTVPGADIFEADPVATAQLALVRLAFAARGVLAARDEVTYIAQAPPFARRNTDLGHYYRHVREAWTAIEALLGPDASRELIDNENLVPIPSKAAMDSGLTADTLHRVAGAALRHAERCQGMLPAISSIRPGTVIEAESGRPSYYWFKEEPDPWPNCHVVTFEPLHPNVLCSTSAALVRPDDASVLFFGSLGDEG